MATPRDSLVVVEYYSITRCDWFNEPRVSSYTKLSAMRATINKERQWHICLFCKPDASTPFDETRLRTRLGTGENEIYDAFRIRAARRRSCDSRPLWKADRDGGGLAIAALNNSRSFIIDDGTLRDDTGDIDRAIKTITAEYRAAYFKRYNARVAPFFAILSYLIAIALCARARMRVARLD